MSTLLLVSYVWHWLEVKAEAERRQGDGCRGGRRLTRWRVGSAADLGDEEDMPLVAPVEERGLPSVALKRKFIEGSSRLTVSLVALALVLGLAFCIERIIYLTLSEINTLKEFMEDLDALIGEKKIEEAKDLCRKVRADH